MQIVFQSVVMGALVIIAASSIVFPIIFLVQRLNYQKKKLEALRNKDNQ